MVVYLLLLVMTFLGAWASTFFKKLSLSSSVRMILKERPLYVGCGLYGCAALLNVYVLHYLEYSKVLPLTAITYIWTMVLSKFCFNEHIDNLKIIGVGLIVIGAVMIAQ